ncbi:MAG: TIGR02300 family protein [Rhodobacteraceae bacterium]|nr:TIGR02300 family protein [Paracoccaceae bacterium]
MAKEEWGTKRVCPTTGKRFYDLGRTPIVSPYSGEVVEIETGNRTRSISTEKAAPKAKAKAKPVPEADDETVVLEDDDTADVDLGDEVLEDDDDDTVALDDIADVASDDDDT